jgi:hypothetical protein
MKGSLQLMWDAHTMPTWQLLLGENDNECTEVANKVPTLQEQCSTTWVAFKQDAGRDGNC